MDGLGEGIFGASHGYYRRPGDGNTSMCVYVCVCVCVGCKGGEELGEPL